jgi:hypothetical protein
MKVTYSGPEPEIEIARAGMSWTVKQGESVDLPDEVAAGLDGQDAFDVTATKTTGRKATTDKDDQ